MPAADDSKEGAKSNSREELKSKKATSSEGNSANSANDTKALEDGPVPKLIDPNITVRHPWFRIFTSLVIVLFDFIIFGEDPIQDSEIQANLPIVGNIVNMVIARWPASGGYMFLKVVMLLLAIVIGCVFGRQFLHHWCLRDKLKLTMFRDKGDIKDQGSFFIMGVSLVFWIYLFSVLYNAMVGDNAPKVGSDLGITNRVFGKIAQGGTWLGDLATIVMVWDAMFQDPYMYKQWAAAWKKFYVQTWDGYFRVVLSWSTILISTMLLFISIYAAGGNGAFTWRGAGYFFTNEAGRTFLVMLIVLTDLSIVVQDWDFPSFKNPPLEVKVAGTFETNIKCCQCCAKMLDNDFFDVQIAGKWMNYGPLMVILALDINMLKNQIVYKPWNFGQYTDEKGQIWTIVDPSYTNQAYTNGVLQNKSMISWEARRGLLTNTSLLTEAQIESIMSDIQSTSRWHGDGAINGLAYFFAVCSFGILFFFMFLTWYGNKMYQARHGHTAEKGHEEEEKAKAGVRPKRSSTEMDVAANIRGASLHIKLEKDTGTHAHLNEGMREHGPLRDETKEKRAEIESVSVAVDDNQNPARRG